MLVCSFQFEELPVELPNSVTERTSVRRNGCSIDIPSLVTKKEKPD